MIHVMRRFWDYGWPMSYCNRRFETDVTFSWRPELATCLMCRARAAALGELELTAEERAKLDLDVMA